MIEVTISRSLKGQFTRLEIKGHAEYADFGQDIVCAGASALAQTSVLGLKQVAGIKPVVASKSGYFSLELPDRLPEVSLEKAVCIAETLCLGLEDMAKSYPSHIRVKTIRRCCR